MIRRLQIGIDLDGVTAFSDPRWIEYFNENHPNLVSPAKGNHIPKTWEHWTNVCDSCFTNAFSDPDVVRSYDIMPHAYGAFAELTHKMDLHIVTARPQSVHAASVDWLRETGLLTFCSSVNFEYDKATFACRNKLDYHVDDSPRIIKSFQDDPQHCKPIIFDQPYNRDVAGIRVRGWLDIMGFLKAQDIIANIGPELVA